MELQTIRQALRRAEIGQADCISDTRQKTKSNVTDVSKHGVPHARWSQSIPRHKLDVIGSTCSSVLTPNPDMMQMCRQGSKKDIMAREIPQTARRFRCHQIEMVNPTFGFIVYCVEDLELDNPMENLGVISQ